MRPLFIHSPHSRSSTLLEVVEDFGLSGLIDRQDVQILRQDGSGRRDPANPHPEGKVPALVLGDEVVTERGAIILALTDLFPQAGLGPAAGEAGRGAYLTWLVWYQGVFEPVAILDFRGIRDEAMVAGLRGMAEAMDRLRAALARGPWLLGQRFSAADLLCRSLLAYFPQMVPDDPLIRDWLARCGARPGVARAAALDAGLLAA